MPFNMRRSLHYKLSRLLLPNHSLAFGTLLKAGQTIQVQNPYDGRAIPKEHLEDDLLREAALRLAAPEDGHYAPTSGGVILHSHDSAEVAVAAALASQTMRTEWSTLRMDDRLEVVRKLPGLLESGEGTRLAQIVCEETGKPLRQARAEVRLAASRVRHLIGMLQQLPYILQREAAAGTGKSSTAETPGTSGGGGGAFLQPPPRRRQFVEWEPLGVVASITAWNFPVVLSCDLAVPALALGNAVVAKPSEHSVLVGLALEELWRRAGLPQGLYQSLVGGPAVGQQLVRAPEVGAVFFTGSRAAGRAVAAAAAALREVPIPSHLELGGKDVVYVHDDVVGTEEDGGKPPNEKAAAVSGGARGAFTAGTALRRVAAAVADAAFVNSGQMCCAPKLVLVAAPLAADFAHLLAERVVTLTAGDPADPTLTVDLGPLTERSETAAELGALVREALEAGAVDVVQEVLKNPSAQKNMTCTPGGGVGASPSTLPIGATSWEAAAAASGGSFFAPRVLLGVHPRMRVVAEETFGPVLCVLPVSSLDEARDVMSRSRYGLTASCYSRDEAVARALLDLADVGTVFWNGCGEMPVGLPWSGRRWSGLGYQLGGVEGFKSFMRPKSYVFNRMFGP